MRVFNHICKEKVANGSFSSHIWERILISQKTWLDDGQEKFNFTFVMTLKKTTNWATKGRVISRAMRSLLQQISIDRFG